MDKLTLKQRKLWFDVGIKRYTTASYLYLYVISCGLM